MNGIMRTGNVARAIGALQVKGRGKLRAMPTQRLLVERPSMLLQ